jgi:hypothetical protein
LPSVSRCSASARSSCSTNTRSPSSRSRNAGTRVFRLAVSTQRLPTSSGARDRGTIRRGATTAAEVARPCPRRERGRRRSRQQRVVRFAPCRERARSAARRRDHRRGERLPSDILPWLRLQEGGVKVRMLEPNGAVLTADEVEAALTRRTRAVCLTWVHSFSGCVLDLDAVGAVCREHGAWFTSTDRKQSAHVRSTSERRRSTPSSVPASNGSAARTEPGCAGCDPSCSTRFARPSSTGSAR